MSISNHALVGAAIAFSIKQPALVIPLAFASHFVIDLLPHYGYHGAGIGETLKHKLSYFEIGWSVVALVLLLFNLKRDFWLGFFAAFAAILPDLEWPYRYFLYERKGKKPPRSLLAGFHSRLQWGERPWGIYIEIAFFIVGFILFRHYFA